MTTKCKKCERRKKGDRFFNPILMTLLFFASLLMYIAFSSMLLGAGGTEEYCQEYDYNNSCAAYEDYFDCGHELGFAMGLLIMLTLGAAFLTFLFWADLYSTLKKERRKNER